MNDQVVLSKEFSRALGRLRAGAGEDPARSDLVYDGVIQRFEFCFELGWKLLRSLLHHQGVEASTPRACIKEAFRAGILHDGDSWISMLEARNRTSHLYDQDAARDIYRQIKEEFLTLLGELEKQAAE